MVELALLNKTDLRRDGTLPRTKILLGTAFLALVVSLSRTQRGTSQDQLIGTKGASRVGGQVLDRRSGLIESTAPDESGMDVGVNLLGSLLSF